jgi:glutamine cyclotransferase
MHAQFTGYVGLSGGLKFNSHTRNAKGDTTQKILGIIMKKQHLAGILTCTVVILIGTIIFVLLSNSPVNPYPLNYSYDIVNVYPHDENAFTQGLVFEDGILFESTGLYGQSTLRRVELDTGMVIQLYALPDQFFGEGITVLDDKIIQLTWQSNRGFVYDKHSFDLLQEFSYPTEGWGITHDDSSLIMSDGTATLYFLNPETFEKVSQIEVYDVGPVTELNELEFINGEVYANIWKEDKIAIINPQSGQVTGWIDLEGIQDLENLDGNDVLNGIAYDAEEDRLFVTGKGWSQLFEINLILLD